jgi:hypothetical protein
MLEDTASLTPTDAQNRIAVQVGSRFRIGLSANAAKFTAVVIEIHKQWVTILYADMEGNNDPHKPRITSTVSVLRSTILFELPPLTERQLFVRGFR